MLHTRFCSSHSHAQLRADFVSFTHPWASMCSPSLSPSLFPSHIHTPTGILVASSHSITHAHLDSLGACKSPAASPVLHQHSHMHHPKCSGAGEAATGTEQQVAPQMFLCSRHLTAPPSLASYVSEPDFGLMDVDVGQEAQGNKEYWGSSI